MALPNFISPPTVGQQQTINGTTYEWDGTKWFVIQATRAVAHNATTNRNAAGAHDDIYIRSVTLAEAIAEDATTGTRYTITDLKGARYDVVTGTDTGGFYKTGLASGRKLKLIFDGFLNLGWFGEISEVIDSSAVFSTAVIEASTRGVTLFGYGTVAINDIDIPIPNGLKFAGDLNIIAIGSPRLKCLRFTQVRADTFIDGLKVDGSNIVSQPFIFNNVGSVLEANVHLSENTKCVNARSVSGSNNTAAGIRFEGLFKRLLLDCTIETVYSDNTSGADSIGLLIDWESATEYTKDVVIGSKFSVKNVSNANTVIEDADGVNYSAPTSALDATLTVCDGSHFEDCQGRSIKSQVSNNSIGAAVIKRKLYDGLSDIDLQYGGGNVVGTKFIYEGRRVNSLVNVSSRINPANEQSSVSKVSLTVLGTPSSNTDAIVSVNATDENSDINHIVLSENRSYGATNHFVTIRSNNDLFENNVTVKDNFAKTVATSFIESTLFGTARTQLNLTITGNNCEDGCSGGTFAHDVTVIEQKNNKGISSIRTTAFSISAGIINTAGEVVYVANEGGATSDNLDTIGLSNYQNGQRVTFFQNNSGRTSVLTEVGNIVLGGSNYNLTVDSPVCLIADTLNGKWYKV